MFWNEEGLLDTSTPGAKLLFSKYGAGGDSVRMYVVKKKPTLGIENTIYDDFIIAESAKQGMPAPLLKSLIREESGTKFNKDSYRYEPCIDHDWFSGLSPTIGLNNHPYHHYRLAGKNLAGTTITEGDQVKYLNPAPLNMAKSYTDYTLKMNDPNNDGSLILKELWASNNSVQHWSKFCTLTESQKEFTPQFLLAASYGLGQLLYETAITHGFDTRTEGNTARNLYDLFQPQVSIQLAATKLEEGYIKTTPEGNKCETNQDWWLALRNYNGTGPKAEEYATRVCNIYKSGMYNLTQ